MKGLRLRRIPPDCTRIRPLMRLQGAAGLLRQHSRSSRAEPERIGKVLHLQRGERFSQGIGHHISSGAIEEPNIPLLTDPANKMITDVDVLGTSMKKIILGNRDSTLIIA